LFLIGSTRRNPQFVILEAAEGGYPGPKVGKKTTWIPALATLGRDDR
jgi:hypothetical protein